MTTRWTVCLSLAEIFGAAGLGASVDLSDTCDEGGPDLIVLETEGLAPGQAELDGNVLLGLAGMLMMPGGPGMPGGELPPGVTQEQIDTLLSVITIVGVPLRARVEILLDGEVILVGLKRFAITTRDDPTTIPPAPRFAIDGAFVNARDNADMRVCVPESGEPIAVQAGAEVTLSPSDDEEEWFDEYPVFNLTGELQLNEESAFYNWFSTGGEFSREITQFGDHDTVWTTPEQPGEYPIWVVVRDGHLGTSWCRATVTVGN